MRRSTTSILPEVRFWSYDRHPMPLPTGHRFPQSKYRLLREAVEAAGLGEVWHAGPVPWASLEAVHDPATCGPCARGR